MSLRLLTRFSKYLLLIFLATNVFASFEPAEQARKDTVETRQKQHEDQIKNFNDYIEQCINTEIWKGKTTAVCYVLPSDHEFMLNAVKKLKTLGYKVKVVTVTESVATVTESGSYTYSLEISW